MNRLQYNPKFRFIDLFAGIGGFRLGFEHIGGECVYTNEWNEYSRKTYLDNFPETHEIGDDISKIKNKDLHKIPQYDVLLAGFPCQPFSLAGVSSRNSLGRAHGFACEVQGTLFFDVARFIKEHQPKAFLLENVKNLVGHDKGNTFKVIRKTLEEELGYFIDYKVIDAKGYVPQHRERIFIAGFKKDTGFRFDYMDIPDPKSGPKLDSVYHPEDGTEYVDEKAEYLNPKTGKVDPKFTLSPKLWNYLQDYAKKHQAKGNGFGFSKFTGNEIARTLSARYHKDGSEILVHQARKRPRRLTPRECARLMGFDPLLTEEPSGKKQFKIPVSNTRSYMQFGNAVVVPVVKHIAENMEEHITKLIKADKIKRQPH